ncbi:DUF1905 domain-containing protein [Alteraurantiacibacter aquimixticola]|uniref:DUF1905 domain-containing protein n=1 Tax=Alteraurantiacibacter aquimixticola TaxID=2489173 RepID=A0A4T3F0T3_9SPHN|nr:DUF1905 domain-containing protein [Alteraurantiacibacter aquimixticola]TIX49802.1 DUF1905 domain-containing protein [Alteraurantiacibacter aquimixticola]
MQGEVVSVTGELLGWRNDAGMLATYLKITGEAAQDISAHELHARITSGKRRGFGSVKVEARIGESSWTTSVFPQDEGWFLPVKAAVRRAEALEEGTTTSAEITLL